jgi:hypothetical protein
VRREWEQTRAIAFSIAQYSYGGCKKKNPQQFWKLPWDKNEGSRVQDILKQHALMKARRQQLENAGGKS